MGVGKKFLAGVMVASIPLLGSGMAFATEPDTSHSVAYSILSFRFITVGTATADFETVRQGDIVPVNGGSIGYATTMTSDKIEVELDSDLTNGLVLGINVVDLTAPGGACVDKGTPQTATPAIALRTGGVTWQAGEPLADVTYEPVRLSKTAPKILISNITNCGDSGASQPTASIQYILDTSDTVTNATPLQPTSGPDTIGNGQYTAGVLETSIVTFTLKA